MRYIERFKVSLKNRNVPNHKPDRVYIGFTTVSHPSGAVPATPAAARAARAARSAAAGAPQGPRRGAGAWRSRADPRPAACGLPSAETTVTGRGNAVILEGNNWEWRS